MKRIVTDNFALRILPFGIAGAAVSASANVDSTGMVEGESAAVPETLLDEILDEVDGALWRNENHLALLSVLA